MTSKQNNNSESVTSKRKRENEQNEGNKRPKLSELPSKEISKQTNQSKSLSNEIPTQPQPSVEEHFLKCIDNESDDETQHSPVLTAFNFATREETPNLFDKTQTIVPTLQPTHAPYNSLDFHEPCLSAAPTDDDECLITDDTCLVDNNLNSNKEKQQKLEIKTMTPTQSQTQEEQAEKFINQNDESLKNKDEKSSSNEPLVKEKKTSNNNNIKKPESNNAKSTVTSQNDFTIKESLQQPLPTTNKTKETLIETEKPKFIKKKTKNEKISTTKKPNESDKDSVKKEKNSSSNQNQNQDQDVTSEYSPINKQTSNDSKADKKSLRSEQEDMSTMYPLNDHNLKKKSSTKRDKVKQKKLFTGITFSITGCKSTEVTANDLKNMIQQNGGVITTFVNLLNRPELRKIKNDKIPPLVLIAAKPERTFKYIMALAARIPCLHYNWILHSIQQNVVLDPKSYLLPAGPSLLENGKMIPIPEHFLRHDKNSELGPFETKEDGPVRIEVVGAPEFKNQWTQILRVAGAKVVTRLFTKHEKIDYILSDSEPSDIVLKKARQLDPPVPICSSEWAIQCLIKQKLLDPQQHEAFRVVVEEDLESGSCTTETSEHSDSSE